MRPNCDLGSCDIPPRDGPSLHRKRKLPSCFDGLETVSATLLRKAVPDATVNIYTRGTTTPPAIYPTASGGTALTAPYTTDANGRVIDEAAAALWCDPQSLDIVATKLGQTYTIAYEAFSAGPGSVSREMLSAAALADIEYAFNSYKVITEGRSYIGNGTAAASLLHTSGTQVMTLTGGNLGSMAGFGFDPADHAAGARAVKLRLRSRVWVNNVSPGVARTIQPAMWAFNNAASAVVAGSISGSPLIGSTPAAQTIATSDSLTFDSGDFTAPAASTYAIGVILAGGAIATSSYVTVLSRLLVRQI